MGNSNGSGSEGKGGSGKAGKGGGGASNQGGGEGHVSAKPEKYLTVTVQGFLRQLPNGQLADVVTMELIEEDPKVAEKRAKALVKKSFYRVASVVEKYREQ